jgi:hypothetical protein
MGKGSGIALGVIALLLGAAGLGFGLINWLNIGQPSQNQWYDYVDVDGLSSTRSPINGLSVSSSVQSGQKLYVSFTGTLRCDGTYAEFFIYIDNLITPGHAEITREGVAGYYFFSVAMQHVNDTLTSGTHTVTVWAITDDPGTQISDCVLFVQAI